MLAIKLLAAVCCLNIHVVRGDYTWDDWTAFDEYMNTDDGAYSYEYLLEHQKDNATIYIVNMTSQIWQDASLVSRPVWWHLMYIAVPNEIRYNDAGMLFIGGGSNSNPTPPGPDDPEVILMGLAAVDTGQVVGIIHQVPNQPIVFTNDPTQRSRTEDRLIAWTWRTFIDSDNPDPTVILRMPMTKAAKRGLDTIHNVAKDKAPSTDINRFIVAGGSKPISLGLGANIALYGARIPCVSSAGPADATWLDDMEFGLYGSTRGRFGSTCIQYAQYVRQWPHWQRAKSCWILMGLQNHFRNMNGGWSFAFAPYWDEDLTKEMFNPRFDGLIDVEDMYRYRQRLEGVPKLEMSSSGDEFFLLDDSHQWWNDMPEPKYYFMLPNAEHSMAPHYVKIYETIVSFWLSLLDSIPLPNLTWTMQETGLGGLIVFNTNPPPKSISGWFATTLDDGRRDFRLAERPNDTTILHPVRWFEEVNVADFGGGLTWGAQVEKVSDRWVGFFIEATYDGPKVVGNHDYRMIFTTQVNVVPYTWPRGPCVDADDCYGKLV